MQPGYKSRVQQRQEWMEAPFMSNPTLRAREVTKPSSTRNLYLSKNAKTHCEQGRGTTLHALYCGFPPPLARY